MGTFRLSTVFLNQGDFILTSTRMSFIKINQSTGLKQVMHNHFTGQQANGALPVHLNVLVMPDIKKL